MLNVLALVAGEAAVLAGCYLIFPPAALIVAGLQLGGFALLRDGGNA